MLLKLKTNEKNNFNIMSDMLIVLIVLSILAVYYYGVRVVAILAISVLASVITDNICIKLCRKKQEKKDLSAVITGLTLALMMPSTIPYYIIVTACMFSIIIAKHAFGGSEHKIFSCAAVGYLFVSLCFSDYVLSYPKPFTYTPVNETVNPVELYPSMTKSILSADTVIVSSMDMLIGKFNGPMGCSCLILLLIAAVILIYRKSVSAISCCTQIAVIFIFTLFYSNFDIIYTFHILSSGMFIFGILFLVCDHSTTPKTRSSRFIYGFIAAALTLIFHFYAKAENAIVYAAVIIAPLSIELDRRALSFADMLEKNHGFIFNIKKKINKNLHSVDETLNIVNDGSDAIESTDRITIHSKDEGIFSDRSDI